ncbi:hypothetical protein [Marinobacter sp.]|uniref:hypothetical protein n=1 Tax=Marinobacter sp. TaxID=50741 RepID=UPI00356AA8C9
MKSTAAAFVLLICLASANTFADTPKVKPTVENRYPGPWQTNFNMSITKTLSRNGARGCGIIKYRESSKEKGEYLAVCSADNKHWDAYMVWPNINEAMGPYSLD